MLVPLSFYPAKGQTPLAYSVHCPWGKEKVEHDPVVFEMGEVAPHQRGGDRY